MRETMNSQSNTECRYWGCGRLERLLSFISRYPSRHSASQRSGEEVPCCNVVFNRWPLIQPSSVVDDISEASQQWTRDS